MRSRLGYRLAAGCVFLLLPVSAFADGPSVAFLVYFGLAAFLIVQVWIVGSEFAYLAFLMRSSPKAAVFWWTILINLASSVVGLLPFVGFHFLLVFQRARNPFGYDVLFVLATYPLSVVVEGWLLYHLSRRRSAMNMGYLLKHSWGFNAVSYSGLLAGLAWLAMMSHSASGAQ